MTNIISASITDATFLDDKPQTRTRKYIGVIGSRQLPAIYKSKVKEVIRQLLDKGYDIASGGAVGADNFALEAILELDSAPRGIIFSPWRYPDQFPIPVRENIRKFITEGGKVVWGDTPPHPPTPFGLRRTGAHRPVIVAGLLGRNLRLLSGAVGLVAFPFGESRGTFFTVHKARKKGIPVFIFNFGKEGMKV